MANSKKESKKEKLEGVTKKSDISKEKKGKIQKPTSVLTEEAVGFLRNYINTPSAVGFESGGQKLWFSRFSFDGGVVW